MVEQERSDPRTEADLVRRLIRAASESEGNELSQDQVDRLLGLQPAE